MLFGKPEKKRQFGSSRCKWEDNMKRDFKELGSEDVDWTFLAHDMDQLRTISNSIHDPSLSPKGDGISSIFLRRIPLMLYIYILRRT